MVPSEVRMGCIAGTASRAKKSQRQKGSGRGGKRSRQSQAAAQRAREAAIARAVRGAWVKDFGEGNGERDYAPGYTQLLEGDLVFGDPDSDPDSRALQALLQDAQAIHALILLGDGDAGPANANEEAA